MRLYEMEYKGLNLLDEVCTVELALDEASATVHIYDTNHVVEPTYHFGRNEYELSEGFFKLAEVLNQKYFFVEKRSQNLEKWINSLTWTFYSSNQSIKCFQENKLLFQFIINSGSNTGLILAEYACDENAEINPEQLAKFFLSLIVHGPTRTLGILGDDDIQRLSIK